jgi:hypothetical protein
LVCKSISSSHPFICPSIHLPIYTPIHLYTNPLIHLSIYTAVHKSIYKPICLYTNPSILQSIDPFIHLSLSLSLSSLSLLSLSLSSLSHTHVQWHTRTFCLRSKRSSFSQSVSMRNYHIDNDSIGFMVTVSCDNFFLPLEYLNCLRYHYLI